MEIPFYSFEWASIFGSSDAAAGSWDNVMEKSIFQVMFYIEVLIGCYVICEVLLKRLSGWYGVKLKKLAGSLSFYPSFLFMIYTSHCGSFMHQRFWTWGHVARSQESSSEIDTFANFFVACNIVQGIGQIQTEKPPLLYQLMAHHVLSIACYTSGFYFDRFRWWTVFAGCSEITNLFLVPVLLCKEFFPEWQEQTWYLYNTRLLWSFFLTHRLVLFPCWLGIWFWDRLQASRNGEEDIHLIEGVGYPMTILVLFILSSFWFATINRGLKKQTKKYYAAREKRLTAEKKIKCL